MPFPTRRRSAALASTASIAAALLLLPAPHAPAASTAVADEPDAPSGASPRPGPRISDIQGTTRLSPLAGQRVRDVPGVVTAVAREGSRGYWFQDPAGDGDPRTSEGIFVHTGSGLPEVEVGDEVLVDGEVAEYRPGEDTQTVTQLTDAETHVVSSGNPLPEPVRLTADAVPDAYAPDASGGSVEHRELEPEAYALDFYESLEGMLVSVEETPVISRTTEYGELWITVKPEENRTPRGGVAYRSYDQPNTGRLKVMSLDQEALPSADTGDRLTGTTTGPLDYQRFGGYTVQATEPVEIADGGLERQSTRPQEPGELAVATYNVENLAATDPPATFAGLAEGVVDHLASPDIVALEEIQDDTGPADDGTVTAEETLRLLAEAIEDAGGPRYDWRSIDPEDNRDGGQPGGNIRNVFLFDPERVSFTDREGGDAVTPVRVVDGEEGPALSVSPGRITPGSDAWQESRKPLAGEFVFEGETYFLVTNHFNSKGPDQAVHGAHQPPERVSEEQRHQQAGEVRDFVGDLLDADPGARVIALGDFNDYAFSTTLELLTADGGLVNPMLDLPEAERYTYVFDGNAQALDHILLSPALYGSGPRREGADIDYEIVHLNAEFAEQSSDHDPQVVRVR